MVTHDQKAADFATHELHLDKGVLVEQARTAA
jgi:putative ABC transport system ATP-binding protein